MCWEGLEGLRTEAAPEEDFVDHCGFWVEDRVGRLNSDGCDVQAAQSRLQ